MEVFSITCTTCKSRLKVRDAAVIGQILACPKCGGMVLVKPPQEHSEQPQPEPEPAVTAAVDVRSLQETIGDSTFSDIDDLLSDAPPKPKVPVPSIVPSPAPAPAASAEAPAAEQAIVESGPAVAAPLDHEPLAPPPPMDWAAARPWKYWTMLAGSVVAGVVLAVAVVVITIQLFQDEPQLVVDPAAVVSAADSKAKAAAVVPALEKTAPQPKSSEPVPAATVQPVASVPPKTSKVVENPPAPMPEAPAVAPDPLATAESPAPASVKPADQLAANDSLRKFGPLLDGAAENPLASSEAPSDPIKTPSPGMATEDTSPQRPVLPRPPARLIKVAARLADPLRAIELDGVPLADFLQVMSDLSTIPITLEPDALWFVRSSAIAPVTLKTADTTIGAALTDALRPLGLETTVVDDHLIVALARSTPPRSIKFPIHDLAAGDQQQAALLAQWMTALVAPQSWGEAGGSIATATEALTITQQSAVHAELLVLCEKLRVARGLKPLTAAKFDPATFLLDTRAEQAAAKLATPITLNFSQPTPLVRIVERLGAAAKVRILIDWQSLATVGWTTETDATLLAEKLPLDAALSALVEPMDLTWRVVDAGTLQIAAPQSLANRWELEFYRVEDLLGAEADGDALLDRIKTSLSDGLLSEGSANGEIRFDDASKCLLAALSHHQQRALAKLLSDWRGAKQPAAAANAAASNLLP